MNRSDHVIFMNKLKGLVVSIQLREETHPEEEAFQIILHPRSGDDRWAHDVDCHFRMDPGKFGEHGFDLHFLGGVGESWACSQGGCLLQGNRIVWKGSVGCGTREEREPFHRNRFECCQQVTAAFDIDPLHCIRIPDWFDDESTMNHGVGFKFMEKIFDARIRDIDSVETSVERWRGGADVESKNVEPFRCPKTGEETSEVSGASRDRDSFHLVVLTEVISSAVPDDVGLIYE